MMSREREVLLNQDQVVEIVGVCRKTLWSWRRQGIFPAGFLRDLSGRLLWRRSEVLAWLDERERGSLTEVAKRLATRAETGRGSQVDHDGRDQSSRSLPRDGVQIGVQIASDSVPQSSSSCHAPRPDSTSIPITKS